MDTVTTLHDEALNLYAWEMFCLLLRLTHQQGPENLKAIKFDTTELLSKIKTLSEAGKVS